MREVERTKEIEKTGLTSKPLPLKTKQLPEHIQRSTRVNRPWLRCRSDGGNVVLKLAPLTKFGQLKPIISSQFA